MRRILLVDADAFFVAVARQVDPQHAGRAQLLIVGGSAESRGVVCSASYETRAFGVRSGMAMARAVRLCPQALVVPVPRGACGERSRGIAAVLARFAPVVQASSIDEWYLDLSGTEGIFGGEPLRATAHRIRDAVRGDTELSVSIGGGTSKLVAKLAVELAKPKPGTTADGVHVVDPGGEGAFMRGFALGDLPFVGPRFQERLERFGLRTVPDALAHDEPSLVRLLGEREGRWLWRRVRGIDESPVVPREETKSVGREETFARDLHDDAALERELSRLVERVGADLRGDRLRARTVTVKIKDADFVQRQAGRTLPEPVETDRAIHDAARPLLRRLRSARRVGARLIGVTLSQLASRDGPAQLTLFDDAGVVTISTEPVESERDRRLASTVDAIRARFGRGAIGRG